MSPLFEIKNLSLHFAGKPILNSVSLNIEAGDYLTIIGPNGAGKTSLLKCLMRIYSGSHDSIFFQRQSITQFSQKKLARQISYVPQSNDRVYPFTVEEFVLLARYPHLSPFSSISKEDKRIVGEALQLTGTEDLAERQLGTLSGGERQTVFIAAAIAQGAKTMLLDEPTTFLDPKHEAEIYRILSRLNREMGMTIVAVTHDINNAVLNSNRTIILKNGLVAFAGPSGEIMKNKILEKAFEKTFTFIEHPLSGQRIIVPEVHAS